MAGGVDAAATDQLESGGKVGGNLGGYMRQLLVVGGGRWYVKEARFGDDVFC